MNREILGRKGGNGESGFDTGLNKAEVKEQKRRFGEKLLALFRKNETEPQNQYYLLSENAPVYGNTKEQKKEWLRRYEGIDKAGNVPMELGRMLESVVNDPDSWFGVHKSYSVIDDENYGQDYYLHKIMTEGLINMGDSSSGSIRENPSLDKTVSPCEDMFKTMFHIKSRYKGATGSFLVRIPKEYVGVENFVKEGMEDKVYDTNETGNSVIRPEYIMGYVHYEGPGSTLEYKSREELLANYKGEKE